MSGGIPQDETITMAIPDFQTLMLPLLKHAAAGEVYITRCIQNLADEYNLTAAERAQTIPSGKQSTFSSRAHAAKSYLGRAGLVEFTGRGLFQITDTGRQVLAEKPDRIDSRYLRRFPAFTDGLEASGSGDGEAVSTAALFPQGSAHTAEEPRLPLDEVILNAHRRLESELAGELIKRIRAGSPSFFERLVVELLVRMGYGGSVESVKRALVTGRSGDGGIDGVINQDPLGLDRMYMQAKRYGDGNVVGSSLIREFFGALDSFKGTKGLFVTTSTFTRDAKDAAEKLSLRIVLIDGAELARLMIQHGVGCRVRETLEIKAVDEEFFEQL